MCVCETKYRALSVVRTRLIVVILTLLLSVPIVIVCISSRISLRRVTRIRRLSKWWVLSVMLLITAVIRGIEGGGVSLAFTTFRVSIRHVQLRLA